MFATQPMNVPRKLIYEVIDAKPVYFKNYKEVLSGEKSVEEIAGSNTLQGIIVEHILRSLFNKLDERRYQILTNRLGIQIDEDNLLTSTIAVFEKEKMPLNAVSKQYVNVAPLIDIEIDVAINAENFDSPESYIFIKTQKLLNFGVEKVIWISTSSKKVIVAMPNENWQVIDLNKDIEIWDGILINIGGYLREGGSPFA